MRGRIYNRLVIFLGLLIPMFCFSQTQAIAQNISYTGFENFTPSNHQGWNISDGVWQIVAPTNTNGPGPAYDGKICAWTGGGTGGNYIGGQSSQLYTPAITLPTLGLGQQIVLTFWQWFMWDGETFSPSHGCVQVSTDGGNSWAPVSNTAGPFLNNYLTSSGLWDLASVDLSAYAGQSVQIGFQQVGDGISGPGWYIDDVSVDMVAIQSTPYSTGFENFTGTDGPGVNPWHGWSADEGVWTIGVPTNPNGPGSAFDGTKCAYTSGPGGNNVPGQASDLISPAMALPTVGSGQHITLSFQQWFNWSSGGSGQVQVSTWSNGTWNSWQGLGTGYSGSSGGWSLVNLDLTAYAGQQIQVGFYQQGGGAPEPGWYIDDVSIGSPNPIPTLTSISPNTAAVGATGTTITLTGTGFVGTSQVQWNGVGLTTTYISPTKLTATIPATDLATLGTFNITVFNPAPGGGTSSPITFKVVTAGLIVTLTAPAPGKVVKGATTVTGTITDTLAATGTWTLTCTGTVIGSGTGSSPSVSWNTVAWAEGAHTLVLTEKDAAGNTSSATITATVNNKGTTSIIITRPVSGTAVKGTVTVTGTITDITPGNWTLTDNGVQIGTGTGGSPSVSWDTTKMADGPNKLVLTETDLAGSVASSPTTIVTVNNTGVTYIKITAPTAAEVVSGTVTVTGTIADATPGTWTLDCSGALVASGTGTAVSASWNTTLWAEGSHTLVLTETDAAGNKSSATISVTVNNKGVTSIAITSPANGADVKGTVTVKGTISDLTLDNWTLTDNGATIGSGTGAAPSVAWNTTSEADGAHKLVLTETDAAGHTGSATVTVTVNNTGVVSVVITAPTNNTPVKGTVTVTGTITDATPGTWTLTCNGAQIGSGTGKTVSVSWNTKVFADGANKLVLTETDAAGNMGSSTVTVTVSN